MLYRSLNYGWKHPGGGFTVGGKARGALTKAMRRLGAPAREHEMWPTPSEPPSIAVSAHGAPFTPPDGCARVGVDRPPRQVSFSFKISPRLRYSCPQGWLGRGSLAGLASSKGDRPPDTRVRGPRRSGKPGVASPQNVYV